MPRIQLTRLNPPHLRLGLNSDEQSKLGAAIEFRLFWEMSVADGECLEKDDRPLVDNPETLDVMAQGCLQFSLGILSMLLSFISLM